MFGVTELQSKLIPVLIVAAIIQMAVLAGAVFLSQKLADTNLEIEKSQEILYRATSMERSLLSASMSGSNFVEALGGSDGPLPGGSAVDEVYETAKQELEQLQKLCANDQFYVEPMSKLNKIVAVTRKLGLQLKEQAAGSKSEGMSGMLKVIPSVRALYSVVDKLNTRIDEVIQHEERKKQTSVQARDQYQQMQTVLLFAALVLSLGGAALIPAVMKR